MPHYENVFVTRQEVSAAQVDALADSFAEIITSGGGTIHRREYWGLKSLSYKIKKNRKAHFVLLNIEAPSDTVQEMERNMRLNEDVLRHLTIREEAAPEGPSVMMQGRGERERAHRDSDERPSARPAPAETKGEDTPKAEAKGETKAEDTPKAEAKGEAKAEAKGETKGEDTPKAEAKGEDTPKAEAKGEAKAEAKGEAKAEDTPKAEAKGETKAEDTPKAEAKGEAKAEADILVVPDDEETSEGDTK